MPYTRLVEVGRVVMINYGKDYGKLVVIVDIIDQSRALVDAPGIVRKPLLFKRMAITQFKLDIGKCPKKKDLLAALEPAAAKFAASPWGKKLAAKTLKANQTDFDRFKKMVAKGKK
mmetsp:Transcript_2892/g.4840  ORF Transcript_2892/g.4840 Transcript_2892/m.4840 type:complete len:116 (+) Transcript_2892:112-459(+)|eukprot:CAMPEP_0197483276 /NCGR_PEP_ID=MMETSP1309-20131121/56801_1 /TAXON_ID=464262 /ORGANISM="Genus nov. species nov., Strain RCC998" /LENGTH=115 /DNA_ID=CAMNT_0043025873 /DNA_START=418 /DNA_END=765 /DNA_ORIENTATION=+